MSIDGLDSEIQNTSLESQRSAGLPSQSPSQLEREGLNAYLSASFSRALGLLSQSASGYFAMGLVDRYIETTTYVLRILAEREDFARIDEIEARVLGLLDHSRMSDVLLARVHYILGVCRSFRADKVKDAARAFDQAIGFAMESHDRKAIAYPIYGHAFLSFGSGDLEQAKFHLGRLAVILESSSIHDLEVGSRILRGLIHRNENEFELGIAEIWKAYQALRERPNVVLYVHALHGLGSIYLRKGENQIARHYLDLAAGAMTERETPRLAKMIHSTRAKLDLAEPLSAFDFSLEIEAGVITDSKNRTLNLNEQFVLRDLAHLFFRDPDRIFSKAEIVERVWSETYDPHAHDNRIYVTIRRLRRILEEGSRTDESVIVRAKGGYRLRPLLKVKVI